MKLPSGFASIHVGVSHFQRSAASLGLNESVPVHQPADAARLRLEKDTRMRIANMARQGLITSGFIGAVFAAGPMQAESAYPKLEIILSESQTILGQDFAYPPGKAQITAAIVTLQPNESTGLHLHEAPLFAMVMQGQITVDYGDGITKVYNKDDAFIEAFHTNHNGTNTGTEPVRILTIFAGSDAVKNTVIAE